MAKHNFRFSSISFAMSDPRCFSKIPFQDPPERKCGGLELPRCWAGGRRSRQRRTSGWRGRRRPQQRFEQPDCFNKKSILRLRLLFNELE